MNKAELDLLEKVFAKEIDGSFLQTKSKLAKRLEDEGYLQEIEKIYGNGWPKVVCKGYVLTLQGNTAYFLSDRFAEELKP